MPSPLSDVLRHVAQFPAHIRDIRFDQVRTLQIKKDHIDLTEERLHGRDGGLGNEDIVFRKTIRRIFYSVPDKRILRAGIDSLDLGLEGGTL